ncbi:MAG: phosphatase PAP2 family protein, partial [Chitinophagaceae bacterium]
VAAGTGAYRMLNNKHWFSDVLAGAGIGIASADLVYWFYDKVGKHGSSTVFYPAVTQHSFGLGVVTQFKTSTPHHSSKVLGI